MSKYHPLDVRHPANRDLLSRNFLLDPPAQDRITTSSRASRAAAVAAQPSAEPQGTRRQPRQTPPAQTIAPWGQRGQAVASALRRGAQTATSMPARTTTRRRGGGLRLWIVLIGLAVYFLSRPGNQTIVADGVNFVADFFDDILR